MEKIGDLDNPNTLLTINAPDIKQKITDGADAGFATIPEPTRDTLKREFEQNQADYSSKITHAFSDSLRQIFTVSAGLMLVAAVLVFFIQERELKRASPDATPGEM